MSIVWRITKRTTTVNPQLGEETSTTEILPSIFRSEEEADYYVEMEVREGIVLWNEMRDRHPHMMEIELAYTQGLPFYPLFPVNGRVEGRGGVVVYTVYSQIAV